MVFTSRAARLPSLARDDAEQCHGEISTLFKRFNQSKMFGSSGIT
jgi:hypothetical protein